MKTFLSASQIGLLIIVCFFVFIFLFLNNSNPLIGCKSEQNLSVKDSIVSWKFPEVGSIPDTPEGSLIKLGRKIFIETYKYLGPDVRDSSKRFLGNNMDCQNCHFNAGTQKFVFGLVGTYSQYPAFDSRSNSVITIQQRINSCFIRSMNGRPIPENSNEMNALTAYLKWLSTYVPKGKIVEGNGVPKIALLNRGADPFNGKNIFAQKCMTCHAEDGHGVLNKPANADVPADSIKGYDFPPVMGPQSYNQYAGLYRLIVSASFIHSKMPLSSSDLSLENAYDVAAYINSDPRVSTTEINQDYPDLKIKPVDVPFPPFNDDFPAEQHKYGPYQQMIKPVGSAGIDSDIKR